MAAGYSNLYLEQGTSFSTSITLDDVYNNSYNLVGYVASSQIRKSYYSSSPTATFTTSIDSANGVITLALGAAVTANINAGRYVYDTIITDAGYNVTRILEGVIDVSPCVTR